MTKDVVSITCNLPTKANSIFDKSALNTVEHNALKLDDKNSSFQVLWWLLPSDKFLFNPVQQN